MLKNKPFRISYRNAFSLMEVLIAVIIVGLLASLALSNYANSVERGISREGAQILLAVYAQYQRDKIENELSNTNTNAMIQTSSRNFDPVCDGLAHISPIIQIPCYGLNRKTGLYTLILGVNGTVPKIYCSPGAADPEICEKLGYDTLGWVPGG